MMVFKNNIILYTDGSASNIVELSKRVGGFAYLIINQDERKIRSGAELGITSQQAEMLAVIEGLLEISEQYPGSSVEVRSDSAYIVNCFRDKWYERWIINRWILVKNDDLWKILLDLTFNSGISVQYNWLKGHSGEEFNEIVDGEASKARKQLEQRLL